MTVAVAFLLFFRCVFFGKVGKSQIDANEPSKDVSDTAIMDKPMEPVVKTSKVQAKLPNGILNGTISGIRCNMGTGVIPSHASVENLLANRKEHLKASISSDNTHEDASSSSSEESESGSEKRPLSECAALLKTPVRHRKWKLALI